MSDLKEFTEELKKLIKNVENFQLNKESLID